MAKVNFTGRFYQIEQILPGEDLAKVLQTKPLAVWQALCTRKAATERRKQPGQTSDTLQGGHETERDPAIIGSARRESITCYTHLMIEHKQASNVHRQSRL